MLATLGADVPMADGWSYEIKWDGIRGLVAVEAGRVGITSRLGNDLSGRYPELAGLADALEAPVLLDVEYLDRRGVLASLALTGPNWQTPASVQGGGDGAAMVEASRRLGLEGIVAKRSSSRYTPGRRSREWLKVKHRNQQELVVGGWVEGQGSRRGSFGALLVGWYDDAAALHFAGRVGSGFSERDLAAWSRRLAERSVPSSPFVDGDVPRDAHFVTPDLVVE